MLTFTNLVQFILASIAVTIITLTTAARTPTQPTFPGYTLIAGGLEPSMLDPMNPATTAPYGAQAYALTWNSKKTITIPNSTSHGTREGTYLVPDQMTIFAASSGDCSSTSAFSSSATSYATKYSESLKFQVDGTIDFDDFFVTYSASAGESVRRARSTASQSFFSYGSAHCAVTTFSFTVNIDQLLEPSYALKLAVAALPHEYNFETYSQWKSFFKQFGMGFASQGLLTGVAVSSYTVAASTYHQHSSTDWSTQASLTVDNEFKITATGHGASQRAAGWFSASAQNTSWWRGGSTAVQPTSPTSYNTWYHTVFQSPVMSAGGLRWRPIANIIHHISPEKATHSLAAMTNITALNFMENLDLQNTARCLYDWYSSNCSAVPAAAKVCKTAQLAMRRAFAQLNVLESTKVIMKEDFFSAVANVQKSDDAMRKYIVGTQFKPC